MCNTRKGSLNAMYGKNHSAKTKKLISKHKKGQGKGIPTWNKGKHLSEEHRAKLCGRTGARSSTAKNYKFISPDNIEHIICGEFDVFCQLHSLPISSARFYVNKGIIPHHKRHCKALRANLTGWEITVIED